MNTVDFFRARLGQMISDTPSQYSRVACRGIGANHAVKSGND